MSTSPPPWLPTHTRRRGQAGAAAAQQQQSVDGPSERVGARQAGGTMEGFLGKPYMGPPRVPHVHEEFFRAYFLGAHLAVAICSFPGRILGSEVRPRRFK